MSIVSGVRRAQEETTPTHPPGPPRAVEGSQLSKAPAPAQMPAAIAPMPTVLTQGVVPAINPTRARVPTVMPPMPPVPAGQYDSTEVRQAVRRDRSEDAPGSAAGGGSRC